jgi:alkylated DNA repair dioxygenase AlkB
MGMARPPWGKADGAETVALEPSDARAKVVGSFVMSQLTLFGKGDAPRIDASLSSLERIVLARGAWLDVGRAWLRGEAELFELLLERVAWKSESRVMYDRTVEVPRRYAVLNDRGASLHPIVDEMRTALDARYATKFERVSVALYRDGRDSVAWHGDYVARRMPEALVATVSVGAPRKFLVRPTGGGRSMALSLGWGDLLVMGGSCQRTYQHAIPKVVRADPRIAIMFRPKWEEKDPDEPPTNEQAASSPTR